MVPGPVAAGGESLDPFGEQETLRELCRSLTELVRGPAGRATRIVMAAGTVRVEVDWPGDAAAPARPDRDAIAPPPDAEPAGELVRAEIVGTFYVAAEPGAPPFADVGTVVTRGQQLGIVEAMKLMHAVVAPCAGTVIEVLVSPGAAVEYDQPLLVLLPSDPGD